MVFGHNGAAHKKIITINKKKWVINGEAYYYYSTGYCNYETRWLVKILIKKGKYEYIISDMGRSVYCSVLLFKSDTDLSPALNSLHNKYTQPSTSDTLDKNSSKKTIEKNYSSNEMANELISTLTKTMRD